MEKIRDNVLRVRERVQSTLERCGRAGDSVTIVGVTKTWGPEVVDALVQAGIGDIGENKIQEFLGKRDRVTNPCRWHLVGHLQRNKATKAIGAFSCIQSVDSVRIAGALDRLGAERGIRTPVFLQVNTSGEPNKHGFAADEAVERADELSALAHIEVSGLMTIGPVSMDPAETRACFRRLFELRERINRSTKCAPTHLSMGMTGDFEIAIEEGATVVRLGTILTGERSR